MTNGNEPINLGSEVDKCGNPIKEHLGLTKREYFAAMALQGLMANPCHSQKWSFVFIERIKDAFGVTGRIKSTYGLDLEKAAVRQADALINALNEKP